MSDPMAPEVRDWMKGSAAQPPDPQLSARQVMARLPEVRQRRRWWLVPVTFRKPRSLSTSDAIEYEPQPILAMDGHTPAVSGRTRSMFNPAKAITVGAAVFIGSVLLMAQPFDQQNASLPGAETDAAPQPPVAFSGVWCIGPAVSDRSQTWRNAVAMSDPRLQGDAFQTYDSHLYPGIQVVSSTLSIVNEDGAWVSRRYESTGTPAGDTDSGNVFIGEGAYEGLIAFMPDDETEAPRPDGLSSAYGPCTESHGVIIDGALAVPYLPE